MISDTVFRLCNLLAMFGWLLLIAAAALGTKRLPHISSLVCKFVIPGFLAAVYLGIILSHWAGHEGGFGSITQVQKLFANPWLLVAGWVHYLAFDLFLGAWQVRDASRSNVPQWWTIPSLILTFLFGPIGFLVYLLLKSVRARS